MKPAEFIRSLTRLGRKRGVEVRQDNRGKGSHTRLWYGQRFTTVPGHRNDLKTGTLHGMLKDLGLTLDDL